MSIKRIAGVLFCFSIFLLGQAHTQGKILFLIIAHDSEEHLVAMQNIWKSYMHTDPKHVEAYFIDWMRLKKN